MKVILLKDVGGVGRHGAVVDVADGFALNSLIPRGLAQQATPDKVKAHEAATQKEHETRAKERDALVAKIRSLDGARVEIAARATEKGGLFRSLGVTDIQKAIRDQKGTDVPAETILLEKPIKELGEHAIQMKTAEVSSRLVLLVKQQA